MPSSYTPLHLDNQPAATNKVATLSKKKSKALDMILLLLTVVTLGVIAFILYIQLTK